MSDDIKTVDLSDHATLMDCYKKLSKSHADLRADLAAEREQVREWSKAAGKWARKHDIAHATLKVAQEALDFYANPFERGRTVPDFYGELCFGDVAEEALAQIDAVLGGGDAK